MRESDTSHFPEATNNLNFTQTEVEAIASYTQPESLALLTDYDFSILFSSNATDVLTDNSSQLYSGVQTPSFVNSDQLSISAHNQNPETSSKDIIDANTSTTDDISKRATPTTGSGPDDEIRPTQADESRSFQELDSFNFDSTIPDLTVPNSTFDQISSFNDSQTNPYGQEADGTYDWPANAEFYQEIYPAPFDCMGELPRRALSLKDFFADESLDVLPSTEFPLRESAVTDPQISTGGEQLTVDDKSAPNRKRKRQYGEEERQQVKQTRERGACLRCRIYKEKVYAVFIILELSLISPFSATYKSLVESVVRSS